MQADPWTLVVAGILYVVAVFTAVKHRATTKDIYRHYHSIREGNWGPKWLRWQFRPTRRQADTLAWFTVAFSAALGTAFLLMEIIG